MDGGTRVCGPARNGGGWNTIAFETGFCLFFRKLPNLCCEAARDFEKILKLVEGVFFSLPTK